MFAVLLCVIRPRKCAHERGYALIRHVIASPILITPKRKTVQDLIFRLICGNIRVEKSNIFSVTTNRGGFFIVMADVQSTVVNVCISLNTVRRVGAPYGKV